MAPWIIRIDPHQTCHAELGKSQEVDYAFRRLIFGFIDKELNPQMLTIHF